MNLVLLSGTAINVVRKEKFCEFLLEVRVKDTINKVKCICFKENMDKVSEDAFIIINGSIDARSYEPEPGKIVYPMKVRATSITVAVPHNSFVKQVEQEQLSFAPTEELIPDPAPSRDFDPTRDFADDDDIPF